MDIAKESLLIIVCSYRINVSKERTEGGVMFVFCIPVFLLNEKLLTERKKNTCMDIVLPLFSNFNVNCMAWCD